MINLTLDEAKKIAAEGDYKVIPISCEFFSDVKTPVEVLRILKKYQPACLYAGIHRG